MHLTRRDFARFGALGLAARFAPALNAQNATRKTGYAIIGIGRIAYHFMRRHSEHHELAALPALVSGHPRQGGQGRGAVRRACRLHLQLRQLRRDCAQPKQSTRCTWRCLTPCTPSTRCARPRRASTCSARSPCAPRVADAEAMIAACKAANVKLMIAYRCHYEPFHLRAIQMIRDGKRLGQVQEISSCFGFNIAPGEWRLNKMLAGGGPLYDVGIYSLNATPISYGRGAGETDRGDVDDRPRRALQRSGREHGLDDALPVGNCGQLLNKLRSEHGRLLQGLRLQRLARARSGFQLRRGAHGAALWTAK